MARVTRVAPHLTLEQVKQKLHSATSIWLRERWLVIYTAMLEPRPAQAIATQLGVSRPFVAKNQLPVEALRPTWPRNHRPWRSMQRLSLPGPRSRFSRAI